MKSDSKGLTKLLLKAIFTLIFGLGIIGWLLWLAGGFE